MVKVLHIFNKLDRGGAELRTIQSLPFFSDELEFIFLSTSGKRGSLDLELEKKGYKIYYLKLKDLFFIFKFVKLLRKENINIIHSHLYFTSGIITIINKIFYNSKMICHFRTSRFTTISFFKKIYYFIMKIIINKFSDKIVFVSNASNKKGFPEADSQKKVILYNGFLKPNQLNLKRKFITHVGRFNEAKNQKFLLDIVKKFSEETFVFVGNENSKYFQEFKRLMVIKNIENVIILGEVNNVDEILQETKIFLFPSTREGLPGAMIEAALNNCFILASNIDENIEVQQVFKENILTLPLNSLDWMEKLRINLDIKNKMQKETSTLFSMELYVRNLTNIYQDLVE